MTQYAPRQLREITEISQETYRHWRRVLPPLSKVRGQGACYAPGDLVAVSVVRVLVSEVEMRVRGIAPMANDLFEVCRNTPWPTLERGRIDFDMQGGNITFALGSAPPPSGVLCISVPLRPITKHIQARFVDARPTDQQGTLRFPPTPLQASRENARGEDRPTSKGAS